MSIRIMSEAWGLTMKSHTAKLVLLALADNANDAGVCWPSITTIAKKCSLSRQGVVDQIAKLESLNVISATREAGKSTRYKITIPVNDVDQLEAETSQPDRRVVVNRVDQSTALTSQPHGLPVVNGVDHHPSTSLTTPVYAVDSNHQEPSKEPSVEPPICSDELFPVDSETPAKNKARAESQEEIEEYLREKGLFPRDAEWLWVKWEGNGWTNQGKKIKDWKRTVTQWHLQRDIFPSDKKRLDTDFWPEVKSPTIEDPEEDLMARFERNRLAELRAEAGEAPTPDEIEEGEWI